MSSYKEMPKAVVIVFICRILGEFQAAGHVLDVWFLLKALILTLSRAYLIFVTGATGGARVNFF